MHKTGDWFFNSQISRLRSASTVPCALPKMLFVAARDLE